MLTVFGCNPAKFAWDDIDEDIMTLKKTGKFEYNWSVVSHKTIQSGDRAYIMRLGQEPKGIFAIRNYCISALLGST